MKQTKNEITRETAPEYPDLDQALEQLAGEVPPMPSGLHEKWMNAVKTEAAKREEPETETGEKETAGKRTSTVRTAARSRKQKEAVAEEKRSLTILLPPAVYIGLKMMAIRRMTKVSSLICDLYRDEEEREKRRTRQ